MMYYRKLIDDKNNQAAFDISNIASKMNFSPRIYFHALFVGMLETVDPNKVYFKILHKSNRIVPAVTYIIRRASNANDSYTLCIHDPRLTVEDHGPYEAPEFISCYMNLIAMYLLRVDKPEINFDDFETVRREIAAKIKSNMQLNSARNTVAISFPCSILINLLNSKDTKRHVAEYKQQSNEGYRPSRCSIT